MFKVYFFIIIALLAVIYGYISFEIHKYKDTNILDTPWKIECYNNNKLIFTVIEKKEFTLRIKNKKSGNEIEANKCVLSKINK